MINFGNIIIADLRLGATQVGAAYVGNKQVWSLGPVVLKYDIQSIGRTISKQGTTIEITEQAGETITLYIKTNATDLTNKQVCAAVYLNSTDVTPYASFAFSNVSLAGRYITGTTPDVSTWVPSGFPETYSTLYMKTWIQDAGSIDPVDALGEVLDWTGTEFIPKGLKFVAEENNSTIGLKKVGSAPTVYLLTSDNGVDWSQYTIGDSISLPNVGDYVYFKAAQTNINFAIGDYSYNNFFGTGKIGAYGDVEYLRRDENTTLTSLAQWTYKSLFADCSALTHAPELTISASVPYCAYNYMFANCTSLSTGPSVIPSNVISQYGCIGMFQDCSALTAAPEISATSIGEGAFSRMFNRCTSLIKAPSQLKATVVSGRAGYDAMFMDCVSLSSSPIIDLITLGTYNGYTYMFNGCTNLQKVEFTQLTSWGSAPSSTKDWMKNVAASGTFICPEELPDTRGTSNIPVGWTVAHPAVAALRFDILADDTSIDIVNDSGTLETPDLEYSVDDGETWTQWVPRSDFPHEMAGAVVYVRAGATGNTGFADPNTLSAYWHFTSDDLFSVSGNIMYLLSRDGSTGLSDYCFYRLFDGCTMLVDASDLELPATTLADGCYDCMFSGCTSLTTAPALPATTLAFGCYKGMLSACTSLTAAPELPATTLADHCYHYMFRGCTALVATPELPATSLADGCYASMFSDCSSLSSVEVPFTAWNPQSATISWLRNVAASGTFTCPAALPDIRNVSHIPEGWTKVDAA